MEDRQLAISPGCARIPLRVVVGPGSQGEGGSTQIEKPISPRSIPQGVRVSGLLATSGRRASCVGHSSPWSRGRKA
jgi:hypothetical protein